MHSNDTQRLEISKSQHLEISKSFVQDAMNLNNVLISIMYYLSLRPWIHVVVIQKYTIMIHFILRNMKGEWNMKLLPRQDMDPFYSW